MDGDHAQQGAENAVEMTLSRLRRMDPQPAPPNADVPRTLADLYRDHRMRMVRLAVLLVDDPATGEDVVQEAFTGLHRHWSGLRDEAAAVGYLRAAVVNGSRSVLRRRRTPRDYVPPHQVNARSAESLAMLSAQPQAGVDALAPLAPRQRGGLGLRDYRGVVAARDGRGPGDPRRAGHAAAAAARGAGAAVLRRAVRGRDRRGHRDHARHRQVDREPGARRRRPGHEPWRPVNGRDQA